MRQPRFVAFILAYSSWLLSYNQLYLALPVEIQRSGGREQDLAPLFMLASLLIITLQLPLARFARRIGAVRILPVGFLLLSASFVSVALFVATPARRRLAAISTVGLLCHAALPSARCCWCPQPRI